jgi:hypothetical protein
LSYRGRRRDGIAINYGFEEFEVKLQLTPNGFR